MKNFIVMLSALALISCNDDPPATINITSKHQPAYGIEGRYKLIEMYTETPVDVNYDGVPTTNMLEEIDCLTGSSLETFRAVIEITDHNNSIVIDHANSKVTPNDDTPPDCFHTLRLPYDFDFNFETHEFEITSRFEERETECGYLISAKVIDDMVITEYDKIFFTSEGWQTVRMHMKHQKLEPGIY